MTTHTPGPWQVTRSINGLYIRRRRGTLGDAAIAKVLKVSGQGHLLEREQEAAANARAMAAVPDLIATLRRAVAVLDAEGIRYGDCDDEPLDVLQAARAVLAQVDSPEGE